MNHFSNEFNFSSFKFIFLPIFLIIVIFTVLYQTTRDETVATVVKSERVCESGKDGECKYMIFTKDEVLENSDSLLNMKFNSSDYYANIEVGKTYEFYVVGWRVPFFSMYRNILDYSEIK